MATQTALPRALPQPVRPPGRWRTAAGLAREVLVVGVLVVGYEWARLLGADHVQAAFDHASHLWHAEQWLHLPHEQGLQALVLRVPDLVETLNAYYAAVHFPLTFGVLAWLFLRHREHYSWARRSLLLATAIGLVLQLALPVAPPRMRGDLGFVDTAVAYGMSVYGGTDGHSLSNQYAAMPSLHVGWALLVAVVCIRALRSRWRWLWVLHPAVTVLVVVATGNHWWLDSLFGLALVSTSLVVCLPRRSAPLPAAGPAPAGERLPSAA